MKTIYRGHEIEAKRERSMGGDRLLYFTVYRQADGLECVCDFTTGSDTPADMIGYLKKRVDDELASPDPWDELASRPLIHAEP